jgi:hypothetical protein
MEWLRGWHRGLAHLLNFSQDGLNIVWDFSWFEMTCDLMAGASERRLD